MCTQNTGEALQSNWTSSDKLVLFRRQNEHFLGTHESVVIAIYAGYKGIQGMPKTFYLEGQYLRTSRSYSDIGRAAAAGSDDPAKGNGSAGESTGGNPG